MIYTAENNVLAALEVAMRIPLEFINSDYLMIALDVPDDADVYKPKLATNWNLALQVTQKIGDDFLNKGKPDVPADIDGTPRPRGTGWDAGAYEAGELLVADGFESGDTSGWSAAVRGLL
jgi:hypothetical protein